MHSSLFKNKILNQFIKNTPWGVDPIRHIIRWNLSRLNLWLFNLQTDCPVGSQWHEHTKNILKCYICCHILHIWILLPPVLLGFRTYEAKLKSVKWKKWLKIFQLMCKQSSPQWGSLFEWNYGGRESYILMKFFNFWDFTCMERVPEAVWTQRWEKWHLILIGVWVTSMMADEFSKLFDQLRRSGVFQDNRETLRGRMLLLCHVPDL